MQYAVGVSPKRSTHTVDLANISGGGLFPLVQKSQTHAVGYTVGMQYAVGMQYTEDVGAKRSTHTVDLANMGGGDR